MINILLDIEKKKSAGNKDHFKQYLQKIKKLKKEGKK